MGQFFVDMLDLYPPHIQAVMLAQQRHQLPVVVAMGNDTPTERIDADVAKCLARFLGSRLLFVDADAWMPVRLHWSMSEQRTLLMLAARCAALEAQATHRANLITVLADAAHLNPAERNTLLRLVEMLDQIAWSCRWSS